MYDALDLASIDKFVYLYVPPVGVAMDSRIHIRNRGGESGSGITVPYLDRMVTKYNVMMW